LFGFFRHGTIENLRTAMQNGVVSLPFGFCTDVSDHMIITQRQQQQQQQHKSQPSPSVIDEFVFVAGQHPNNKFELQFTGRRRAEEERLRKPNVDVCGKLVRNQKTNAIVVVFFLSFSNWSFNLLVRPQQQNDPSKSKFPIRIFARKIHIWITVRRQVQSQSVLKPLVATRVAPPLPVYPTSATTATSTTTTTMTSTTITTNANSKNINENVNNNNNNKPSSSNVIGDDDSSSDDDWKTTIVIG
jgi:hypothetical protein